jgi:hypothetical protein
MDQLWHLVRCGESLLGTTTAYNVCISLVLILVVMFLGGEGTSSEDWYPLVLETTLPSRKTSKHTHTDVAWSKSCCRMSSRETGAGVEVAVAAWWSYMVGWGVSKR